MPQKLDLVSHALADYGVAEIPGPPSSADIMAMAAETGAAYPGDEVAWCGLAVGHWVKRAGGALPSGFLSARSWLKAGEPVDTPELGDVVVLWRDSPDGWEGHVALFVARRGSVVFLLGGNQANTVTITSFSAKRILGFRRLYSAVTTT